MVKYNRFDVRKFDAPPGITVHAQCTECGCWVEQNMNACPGCGIPTVWENSKVWTELYGSAAIALRSLTTVPPSTASGKLLCQLCGLDGFRTQADAVKWQRAVRSVGEAEMSEVARYVTSNKSGYPAQTHALAIANLKIKEGKQYVRTEGGKEGSVAIW